ncbi:RNA-directed DNA polymerase, eukaryota [Tanacetum coccineum]|uniref:RNA-directed DNA polymerase, eukaryota n=1 Tax=Tanacetum coccineum TaxID=301880 RepID=A0ABQ4XX71_9ASTR
MFIKSIPIKVNVFAWKLYLDRLPTRSNLSRRNVSLPSLACPLCDHVLEDSSHLFFGCSVAKDIQKLICRWWNLDVYPYDSYEDWLSWFKSIRLGSKTKEMLEGMFYVSWWSLWNFRNQFLFASPIPRKDEGPIMLLKRKHGNDLITGLIIKNSTINVSIFSMQDDVIITTDGMLQDMDKIIRTTEEKVDSRKPLMLVQLSLKSNGTESKKQIQAADQGNDAHVE